MARPVLSRPHRPLRDAALLLALGAAAALLPASAGAVPVVFEFPIDVAQEVPTPDLTGVEPLPSGSGRVELETDTNEIAWTIDYQDLSGPIVSPGAHLHGPAEPGVPTGIQVFLADGDPPLPASGELTGSATLTDEQEAQLLDGLWYVNLHTAMNPAGEIRGQVVPEPATGLLLGGGLAALAARRRARRGV